MICAHCLEDQRIITLAGYKTLQCQGNAATLYHVIKRSDTANVKVCPFTNIISKEF